MNKVFICLANSRKVSGRCIAGKELTANQVGGWIRPISERDHHEISEEDRRYQDGQSAQVLDIVELVLKNKSPHPCQLENYVIDDKYFWVKKGKYTESLRNILDNPATLWNNNFSGTNGINDRVPTQSIPHPIQSLYLIRPSRLTIIVRIEGAAFGNAKTKVRANFVYNNVQYEISVTDPEVERKFIARGIGEYNITTESFITVSLGEAYDGYYYKLAACIFGV